MDAATRRPSRLPEAFHNAYAESADGARPRSALRHPAAPPADAESLTWRFTRADLDVAGHVNNTMYWRLAEEHLPATSELIASGADALLEAEYRAGIGTGDASVRRAGSMLWILDRDGEVASTLTVHRAAET